jgi:hypothetical protein
MDTRLATVSALAAAAAAEIRSRARRGRPLPLLADALAWSEVDALVSWGPLASDEAARLVEAMDAPPVDAPALVSAMRRVLEVDTVVVDMPRGVETRSEDAG